MQDLLRVLDRKEKKQAAILEEALREVRRSSSLASKTFRRAIEALDLPDTRKIILINRFCLHVQELESKRNRTSRLAALLNSTVSIGSVVVPSLLSVQAMDTTGMVYWGTFGISLVTGISTAFLSLFKLNHRKEIYADVLRRLISEGTKYLSLTCEYETRYEVGAHDSFFPLFCKNFESIISSEKPLGGAPGAGNPEEKEEGTELKSVATK